MTLPKEKPLDARILKSRSRIEAALLALLQDRRLEELTIADVVSKAGVGNATFFRHYPDKQALVDVVVCNCIDEMSDLIGPLFSRHDHEAAARSLCEFVNARRPLFRAMLARGGAYDKMHEEMQKRTTRLREEIMEIRPHNGMPATLGSALGISGILTILSWWIVDHPDTETTTVARALDQFVFGPLFGD